jgi:hypothetical protein
MVSIVQHRAHRSSSKLGLHGVAAVSQHVTVKTESPETDPGLTTRFERNAIPLTRNLAGAGDLIQDAIGECQLKTQR